MQNTPLPNANMVPGSESIGFSVNLAKTSDPRHSLQSVIVLDRTKGRETTQGGVTYLVPDNVVVAEESNFKTYFYTFASEKEYCQQMAAEAEVSASGWGFSGEFKAEYSRLIEGEDMSAYGLVEAHNQLWATRLESLGSATLDPAFSRYLGLLPDLFTPDTQNQFFDFLNLYGTHVITTALVGGQLNYEVAVRSSSKYNKDTAKEQLTVEYESAFSDASAAGKAEWDTMDKEWLASRKAQLSGVGGDFAALSAKVTPPADPNTPVNYNDLITTWAEGVKTAPGITGVTLQPIANLAPAAKFHALDLAITSYLNSVAAAHCLIKYVANPGTYPAIQDVGYSILLGQNQVPMPNKPGTGQFSNYWIVLADNRGQVVFNQNVLSGQGSDFDSLVDQARAVSATGAYWVMLVVSNDQTNAPSVSSLSWLNTCGINTSVWARDLAYPGAPFQFTAVGKTNSPDFPGSISIFDVVIRQNRKDWLADLRASAPLYVSHDTAKE